MTILTLMIAAGFVALLKGADWTVKGSVTLAKHLGVSELVIGLTVVAIGTSLPELVVNGVAAWQGNSDLAIGTIIGTNTANIFLILGVSAAIAALRVRHSTVWREIPYALLAIVVMGVLVADRAIDQRDFNDLSRGDGLMLLVLFGIYISYLYYLVKTGGAPEQRPAGVRDGAWSAALLALGGCAVMYIGGEVLVRGSVGLAAALEVPQRLIGLTLLAAGTSLPELAASAVAAYRGQADIAVGNVVGSNIFNVLWILGFTAALNPLPVNPALRFDIGVNIAATAMLFLAVFLGRRRLIGEEHVLRRWQGWSFLALYVAYIGFLAVRG